MNSKFLRNFLFGLVILGYLYYGCRYIQDSSFFIDGKTYYILFDDAMISMRYAYNLAHGLGLVWNAGEYVEGFTNPLWVGYMAFFHLFPIPQNTISLYIQLSGLAFMAATLFFVRKIVEEFTDSLLVMLAATLFTAFYTPLIWWALLGMEVSILVLMLTAAVYLVLRNGPARFPTWAYILLAISTLVRFDMAVPYLAVFGILFLFQPQQRKQHLIWGLGLLALTLGGQTLARYFYYGQLLPNTYYLKIEGFALALRITRGLYALIHLAYFANWIIFLLPLGALFFRRDWKALLIAALFIGQVAYSVYVGGDAWEHKGGANRYISIAMPFFFIGLAITVEEMRRKILSNFEHKKIFERASQLALIVFLFIAFINVNALVGEWKSIERLALMRRSIYIAGTDRNIQTALALRNTVKPGASIALAAAGTIPYFLPDYRTIDILGKADAVIAHSPVKSPMSILDVRFMLPGYENYMRPGHTKWDYAYSFGKLKPDVIVSIWEGTSKEAEPYLKDYVSAAIAEGINVYLRKDSPNILWDKVIIH
ncbi:MAG: hypothetical protein IT310_14630 [Anaerolineales bacterium]|nr:hypothetical protein [Anaerolineales bacterium]